MACDKLLYFGKAAFRNTLRQTAQATADLAKSEPHRSGRFRLAPAAGMPPPVGIAADRPSGVWPGFPHAPGGDLYFTPFFERAGYWDPEGGGIRRLSELGTGPNPMGGWAPGESLPVFRHGSNSGKRAGLDDTAALAGNRLCATY